MQVKLSSSFRRELGALRKVVVVFALGFFLVSFGFLFFERTQQERLLYTSQVSEIEGIVHITSVSIESYDYQTVRSLAKELMNSELLVGLKLLDDLDYILFDTLPDDEQLGDYDVRTLSIGQGMSLVGKPVGTAILAFHPYSITDTLLDTFIFAGILAFVLLVLSTMFLVFGLYRYVGAPLLDLSRSIEESIESAGFTPLQYSASNAFGDFAERYNVMLGRIEAEHSRAQALSESNQRARKRAEIAKEEAISARLNAEEAAEAFKDERDQRKNEAILIRQLLRARNQIITYQTADKIVHSNLDLFPDLGDPAVSALLNSSNFSVDKFDTKISNLSVPLISYTKLLDNVTTLGRHASYVIETQRDKFWSVDVLTLHSNIDVIILTDKTELHLAERARAQDEKLRALGRLTSGVAHDFNNIVNIISLAGHSVAGMVPTFHLPGSTAQQAHQDLKTIDESCSRAAGIISHLLSFSREKELVKERTDLAEFVGGTRDVLKTLLQANITLKTDVEPDLVVEVNRDQFQSCVMNFATNARHAMPLGGTFCIRAYSKSTKDLRGMNTHDQDMAVIEFEDNGVGMDAQTVAKIFDPFFTTRSPGQGTGLGLSMIYGFAEDIGGTITCSSLEGQGTKFTLSMPMSIAVDAEVEQAETIGISRDPKILEGIEIAFIEDEAALRLLTKRALEVQGATVHAFDGVESFDEGLNVYAEDIDIVLSDNMLGDGSAEDIYQTIQNHDLDVSFIVASGYQSESLTALINSGAVTCFIEKPFSIKYVIETIATLHAKGAQHEVARELSYETMH